MQLVPAGAPAVAIYLGDTDSESSIPDENALAEAVEKLTAAKILETARLSDRVERYADRHGLASPGSIDSHLEVIEDIRADMLSAVNEVDWTLTAQGGHWLAVAEPDDEHYDGAILVSEAEPLAPPENKRKCYSDDDVFVAVNDAANTVGKALGDGMNPHTDSVINLVANATLTVLKDHGATIDDIFAANWDDEGEQEVREELGLD